MNPNDLEPLRSKDAARFSLGLRTGGGLLLCAFLLLVAGCTAPLTQAPEQTPTPSSSGAAPATATPVAPGTPIAPTTNAPLTLVWWGPESLSPTAAQPAGPLLAEQLGGFSAANDGRIIVTIVSKARYGKGGLLDYLRTAAPVAPAILPDLIVLDVSEMEAASATGLLQPLEGLLDEGVTSNLYPFAVSAGRFGDHSLAVQYIADLDHLIYRQDLVQTPPETWDDLLAGPVRYALPLSSQQPSASGQPARSLPDVLLSQYLSAGGSYDATARRLSLEAAPLLRVFAFYEAAIQAGILLEDPSQPPNSETVWNSYSQGKAPLANISARQYLAEGSNLKDTAYAAAPGDTGTLRPVANGWALAITTSEPTRQRAAAALIAWLLAPEHQGPLAAAAGWLPTSPAALQQWGDTEYAQFLATQLADAVSLPSGSDSAQAAVRFRQSWESVITGESSPAAAAEAAVNPPK